MGQVPSLAPCCSLKHTDLGKNNDDAAVHQCLRIPASVGKVVCLPLAEDDSDRDSHQLALEVGEDPYDDVSNSKSVRGNMFVGTVKSRRSLSPCWWGCVPESSGSARVPIFTDAVWCLSVGACSETNLPFAKSCEPIDIHLTAPEGKTPGAPIHFRGPHGVLATPCPEDKQPGDSFSVRLAPSKGIKVVVPDGVSPGSKVVFNLGSSGGGREMMAVVPEGKRPGDYFDAVPRAMMVQVPDGVFPGEVVRFSSLNQAEGFEDCCGFLTAAVPDGLKPGQYFAVPVGAPTRSISLGDWLSKNNNLTTDL